MSVVSRTRPVPFAPSLVVLAAGPAVLLVAGCLPVRAAEPAATEVVLRWGDALVAAAQGVTSVLMPLAIAAATAAAARIAGPLRFLVTNTLVERLVRNATDYALNAVAGAVRGRSLTIPLGSAVIARAVQRALDQGPAWLIEAAGGPAGLAEKVFRSLPLEEAAHAGNTLKPGLRAALDARSSA